MIQKVNQNNFKKIFKFEPGVISVAGFPDSGVKLQVFNKLFEEHRNNRSLRSLIFDGECINASQYFETNKIATRDEMVEFHIEWYEGIHKDFESIIRKFMKMGRTIFILNRPQLKTTEDKLDFCRKVKDLKNDLIKNNSCVVILDILQLLSSDNVEVNMLPVKKTYILRNE